MEDNQSSPTRDRNSRYRCYFCLRLKCCFYSVQRRGWEAIIFHIIRRLEEKVFQNDLEGQFRKHLLEGKIGNFFNLATTGKQRCKNENLNFKEKAIQGTYKKTQTKKRLSNSFDKRTLFFFSPIQFETNLNIFESKYTLVTCIEGVLFLE